MSAISEKRLLAAMIDYAAYIVFGMALFALLLAFCATPGDKSLEAFEHEKMIFKIWFILIIVIGFLYYWFSDFYLKGSSLGKRIVGVQTKQAGKDPSLSFSFIHASIKFFAAMCYVISLAYFLFTGRMFYDKWLHITVHKSSSGWKFGGGSREL